MAHFRLVIGTVKPQGGSVTMVQLLPEQIVPNLMPDAPLRVGMRRLEDVKESDILVEGELRLMFRNHDTLNKFFEGGDKVKVVEVRLSTADAANKERADNERSGREINDEISFLKKRHAGEIERARQHNEDLQRRHGEEMGRLQNLHSAQMNQMSAKLKSAQHPSTESGQQE